MGMSASQMRLLSLTARMSDLEYSAQQISNDRQRISVKTEQITKDYNDALNKINLKFSQTTTAGNQKVAMTANVLAACGWQDSMDAQRMLVDASGRVLVSSDIASAFGTCISTDTDGKTSYDLDTFLEAKGYTSDTTKTSSDSPAYVKSDVLYLTNLFNTMKTNGYLQTTSKNMNDADWLYNQLSSGNLTLQKYNANETDSTTGAKGVFDPLDWASGDSCVTQNTDDAVIEKAKAKYDSDMAEVQTQDKQFEMTQKNIDTEHSAVQTEFDSVKKVIDKNIERSFKTFNG